MHGVIPLVIYGIFIFSDGCTVLYPWSYLGLGAAATTMLTENEIAGKEVVIFYMIHKLRNMIELTVRILYRIKSVWKMLCFSSKTKLLHV
jgi:hypothetical protein